MFCPTCGQQQIANSSRFCSQCGFLLSSVQTLIAYNGLMPRDELSNPVALRDSPRKLGLKKGLWILLVGMLLVSPLVALIHIATKTPPLLLAISTILSFFGGLLRMVYALLFEDNLPIKESASESIDNKQQNFLPPLQSIPANAYPSPQPGLWRETSEFVTPQGSSAKETNFLNNE